MKKRSLTIAKSVILVGIAVVAAIICPNKVKAEEVTDVLLQQALLAQKAVEYQVGQDALKVENEIKEQQAREALLLQQAIWAKQVQDAWIAQQAQAIQLAQQMQQALLQQQQQAMADQYAKALLVYNQAQINQQNAIQQTYMLNAVQAMQRAQFQNLVNSNPNIDYKGHLADEYNKYQQYGINAFAGAQGLKK